MSAATESGRAVITTDYVERLLDDVAKRTRFRLANDRFGFLPVALEIDRANVLAARPTAPSEDVEALRAEVERLTRERDRLLNFVGFVRVWIHRQTPPNAVNPITDEMRLEAIQHHPMLNDTDACLAGLAQAAAEDRATSAEAALAKARGLLRQLEWNPVQRQCQVCKQYQPGFWNIDPTEEGHTPDCALAAALTPTDGGA